MKQIVNKYGDASLHNEAKLKEALSEIDLQNVTTSDYFQKKNGLPPVLEGVYVVPEVKEGRLVVCLQRTNEQIGLLPAVYSYLLRQLRLGNDYIGSILLSEDVKYPRVVVTLHEDK